MERNGNGNGETRKTISSLGKEVADNRTSIEVLKSELQQSTMVHKRLDTAIEKLTGISSSIKSMLAVHEEKLSQAEKLDEIADEFKRATTKEDTSGFANGGRVGYKNGGGLGTLFKETRI